MKGILILNVCVCVRVGDRGRQNVNMWRSGGNTDGDVRVGGSSALQRMMYHVAELCGCRRHIKEQKGGCLCRAMTDIAFINDLPAFLHIKFHSAPSPYEINSKPFCSLAFFYPAPQLAHMHTLCRVPLWVVCQLRPPLKSAMFSPRAHRAHFLSNPLPLSWWHSGKG